MEVIFEIKDGARNMVWRGPIEKKCAWRGPDRQILTN
jgi:hypothetical protein